MGTLIMVEDRRLACSEKMLGLKKYWGPVKHLVPLRGSLGLLESNLEKCHFCMGAPLRRRDRAYKCSEEMLGGKN